MDLSFIADWFNSTNQFFQDIWNFMNSGIYEFFKGALVVVTKGLLYSYIKFKIMMLDVAYTVGQEIMQETGVTQQVNSAWSSLPANVRATLSFFNVPQGLTMIFSAIPTRIAMRFIPGSGS
ncbi:TPA: DUF2523 domain-containing protein [Klebsiella pneumoniae]|nr:DUF2523 domain-containing protein [Klebsiella pneumoniae]